MNAPLSQADERALALWDCWREQKERAEYLGESSRSREKADAAVDVLVAIEDLLQADIDSSVQALAAVLMIEGRDESVPGLYRASLAAIRPQLVGAIAEAAARALVQKTEDAA
jgi:hypothetical protein